MILVYIHLLFASTKGHVLITTGKRSLPLVLLSPLPSHCKLLSSVISSKMDTPTLAPGLDIPAVSHIT